MANSNHKDYRCHFVFTSEQGHELKIFNPRNAGMPMKLVINGVLYAQVLGVPPLHNPFYEPKEGDYVMRDLTKEESEHLANLKLEKVAGDLARQNKPISRSQKRFLFARYLEQAKQVGMVVHLGARKVTNKVITDI